MTMDMDIKRGMEELKNPGNFKTIYISEDNPSDKCD